MSSKLTIKDREALTTQQKRIVGTRPYENGVFVPVTTFLTLAIRIDSSVILIICLHYKVYFIYAVTVIDPAAVPIAAELVIVDAVFPSWFKKPP